MPASLAFGPTARQDASGVDVDAIGLPHAARSVADRAARYNAGESRRRSRVNIERRKGGFWVT